MPRPRLWEFGELSDSLDGLCAVVAPVLVHNKRVLVGDGRHKEFAEHTIGL